MRRDIVALRDLGIPVEGERGRGGSYRLKPGYRVPPLMFTSGEAAAVALGLMAARRLGLETESALAKVRRVLPDRIRLGVESLEHTLGFTGELDAAPPDGETLLALAEAARRTRRVRARYTDSAGVETARDLSPYGLVAHNGRWYVAAYDHLRERPPRAARRPLRLRSARRPRRPGPERFDAIAFVSRSLARVPWTHEVEVVLHTDARHRRSAASPRPSPSSSPTPTAHSCACAPTRSTGPPACSPPPAATSPSAPRTPSARPSAASPTACDPTYGVWPFVKDDARDSR